MGKLQPDYITWTLSVNADGLQKEMLEVRNNTKELKAENMRLKWNIKKASLRLSPWLPVLFWFIKRLFFCKKHGTGF